MRWRSVLIATVLTAIVFGGRAPRSHDVASRDTNAGQTEDQVDIGDTFAFEAAARYNERIVANVDAIDTSLTTILAGNVAVLVFAIDKIKELARESETVAVTMMCASILACVVGYMLGYSGRASTRDGVRPRMFVADLLRAPNDALSAAVVEIVTAGEQNLRLRFFKKGLALLAILFLLASTVVVAFARANGNVVY